MKKHFTTILFFGALWGMLEASLGWALHFLPVLISGAILFPIATIIMLRTYQMTDSKNSVFAVAVIAAAIKSINFFMPNLSMFKVLNPMISILVEAALVIVVLKVLSSEKVLPKLIALPVISIAWRTIFLGGLAIQYATGWMLSASPLIVSGNSIIQFGIVGGLISGAIATILYGVHYQWTRKIEFKFVQNWVVSMSVFALAIIATVVVNFL